MSWFNGCQQVKYRWVSAKKDVTPLLTHWSYVFLALTHRYELTKVSHIMVYVCVETERPSPCQRWCRWFALDIFLYKWQRNCHWILVDLRGSCVLASAIHCMYSLCMFMYCTYRQASNVNHPLVGSKIVDHSNVAGASPVGAAPTTSPLST